MPTTKRRKETSPTKPTNTVLQDRFIAHYFACGGVKSKAAKLAGVSYSIVKVWFNEDKEFVERLEEFQDKWADSLAAALIQRGMVKSDTAAIFMLKSAKPELYDDNIRKLKWLAERGMQDPDAASGPTVVILEREPAPHEQAPLAEPVEH